MDDRKNKMLEGTGACGCATSAGCRCNPCNCKNCNC
jgi:hypothetical protein